MTSSSPAASNPGVPHGRLSYGGRAAIELDITGVSVRPTAHRDRAEEASGDPIGEIERLAYLRQEGSISDAEFEVLKARALARAR